MKKSSILILFYFFIKLQNGIAQTVLLSGLIQERTSQEALIGANIGLVNNLNNFTNSNELGYYNLKIPLGKNKIVVSYLGYKSKEMSIELSKDTILNFTLEPLLLAEVTVKANPTNLAEKIDLIDLPMEQIKKIPSLLGEADVLRALTMLPGVNNGTEGSVGLNVRGGSPDQNLILLDGANIYNSSHLFGFFSAFNADAIKKVEFTKGGFSAKHGGRLSSVIDITFKDGNKEKHRLDANVGVLSSKLYVEGPIKKQRSSYMLAGRIAYFDLLNAQNKRNYQNNAQNDLQAYNLYDVNFKTNFQITKNGFLSFGVFRSSDAFSVFQKTNGKQNELVNTIAWDNTIANIRYMHQINTRLFANNQLIFNSYHYKYLLSSRPLSDKASDQIKLIYAVKTIIKDWAFKNNFDYILNEKHNFCSGLEFIQQTFLPNQTKTIINADTIANKNKNANKKGLTSALFSEISSEWSEKWSSKIGVRAVNYNIDHKNFFYLEPRTSLIFNINKKNILKASYSKMNQFIHLLSNNTIGFTNDSWLPATKLASPQSSNQYALGYIYSLSKFNTYFNFDIYYKKMSNLIDYTEGTNPILENASKGWEQNIQKNGKGQSYGFELLARKEYGKLNGFVEYTFSKTTRQFDKINQGNWYPSRFDRTHDFGITLNYAISKKWTISSNFLYSTGTPFSGANYIYWDKHEPIDFQGGADPVRLFNSSKNNLRLSKYHRMDLSFTRLRKSKNGNEHTWNIGAFNIYNRRNSIAGSTDLFTLGRVIQNEFIIEGYQATKSLRNLFGIIPFMTYNFKLK